MNLKILSKLSLPHNKLARFLVLETVACLVSFFLFTAIFFVFDSIIDSHVNEHAPPPIIGERDLGRGLEEAAKAIAALFVSLLFSIPLSVLSHIYIFKKFFIRRMKKDE